MYCKDCQHRDRDICTDEHFMQGSKRLDEENNSLVYSYDEGGNFYVGDYFGCVYFKPMTETNNENL
jgi:hypothetical protein